MDEPNTVQEPWVRAEAHTWIIPDPLDLTFEGFAPEAFAILERLRQEPHIEQYRREKEDVKKYITNPFGRFRDDLAVNWVLPNRMGFETEKNVFSRLLKNDFGAGGCHHHLWMSFYRPPRRRLTDVQLSHCITPDAFTTGLFVGAYMKAPLRRAKACIAEDPQAFLELLNPLLQEKNWRCGLEYKGNTKTTVEQPMDRLPDDFSRVEGFYIRSYLSRDEVIAREEGLVAWAIAQLRSLWPLYTLITA